MVCVRQTNNNAELRLNGENGEDEVVLVTNDDEGNATSVKVPHAQLLIR